MVFLRDDCLYLKITIGFKSAWKFSHRDDCYDKNVARKGQSWFFDNQYYLETDRSQIQRRSFYQNHFVTAILPMLSSNMTFKLSITGKLQLPDQQLWKTPACHLHHLYSPFLTIHTHLLSCPSRQQMPSPINVAQNGNTRYNRLRR